jgi:hypothetical protein
MLARTKLKKEKEGKLWENFALMDSSMLRFIMYQVHPNIILFVQEVREPMLMQGQPCVWQELVSPVVASRLQMKPAEEAWQ